MGEGNWLGKWRGVQLRAPVPRRAHAALPGQPGAEATWHRCGHHWAQEQGGHALLGNAALLPVTTAHQKTCLHLQNSGVCISDYVANPLIFD